jgi:hypothetical protein
MNALQQSLHTAALATLVHPTKRHPRTGKPLVALGLRPDGSPLWPIIGAAEDDWSSIFEGKTPDQVKKDLDDALAAAKAAGGKGDDSAWTKVFGDKKPEEVQEALAQSRKWEDRAKGNKDKADLLDELAKLISGEDEDGKDPEKLKTALAAAGQETDQLKGSSKALKIENAVLRSAAANGGNPDLLADSRSFMSTVAALDPSSEDFNTKLVEAIKKAVEDNPALGLATETGTRRPPASRQQGKPSESKAEGSVASGREAYQARHGKKQ